MEATTIARTDEGLDSTYKEPAPPMDRENPLESMMKRFDIAAEILGLERGFDITSICAETIPRPD